MNNEQLRIKSKPRKTRKVALAAEASDTYYRNFRWTRGKIKLGAAAPERRA
jgi:hypothetical protein